MLDRPIPEAREPRAFVAGVGLGLGAWGAMVADSPLALPLLAAAVPLIVVARAPAVLWRLGSSVAVGAAAAAAVALGVWRWLGGEDGLPITSELAAISVAGGALVTVAMAGLLAAGDRRLLRRLRASDGRDAAIVDAIAARSRPVGVAAGIYLIEHGRFDQVERLALYMRTPSAVEPMRRWLLALARLEYGDLDGAQVIADAAPTEQDVTTAERYRQLFARIEIARGDAAAVLEALAGAPPIIEPGLLRGRRVIIVDAHAALGNDARATELLRAVEVDHPGTLTGVKGSRRPAARIAATLLAGDAAPFRS